MNKIEQLKRFYAQADCVLDIVNAPKDAQTFDKMIIVLALSEGRHIIRRVSLYNSITEKIVAEY